MTTKTNVPPSTLTVGLDEGGVAVEYLDDREVFYHGVPEAVSGDLRTQPGKEVHVLVTDEDGTEGVLVYVNDRKTADGILEDTGVGRLLLGDGEREEAFPGVVVERDGHYHAVEADRSVVEGRVFVFVEDEFGEASYELVGGD
jgi:hypothetical protein